MVKHIVMFRLAADEAVAAEVSAKFKAALEALPATVPALRKIEVGLNEGPADGNWNIVLTAECLNFDDLQTYSAHPDHLACVAIIKPYIAERACVDYCTAD